MSLGVSVPDRVHTTRLKQRLQNYFPDLEDYQKGKDVLLAFECDVGAAISKACQESIGDEAMHISKAAQLLRKEMIKTNNEFHDSFEKGC